MPNNALKGYDKTTLAYVQSAKNAIAINHGLAAQKDPAELMREQNAKIHEAAKVVKRKKGMVRQTPVKTAANPVPVPESISDIRTEADYDSYMSSMFPSKNRQESFVPSPQAGGRMPIESMLPPVEDPFEDDPELAETVQQAQQVQQEIPPRQMVRQQVNQGGRTVTDENPGEQEARILNEQALRSYNGQGMPQEQAQDYTELSAMTIQRMQPQIQQRNVPRQSVPTGVAASAAYAAEPVPPQAQPTRMSEPRKTYDTFTDVRGLPSHGKFYDAPIMGQALKLGDIMLLGDIDDSNKYDSITELYNRRLRGIDPDEILSADHFYLMHWLKASSFPDQPLPIMYQLKCPNCEGVIDDIEIIRNIDLRFDNLTFDAGDVDAVYAKHANGYYAFSLPDGRECDVYLRRRRHDKEVEAIMKQYQRDLNKPMPRYKEFFLRTAVVIEIEGCENVKEKMDYLENLSPVEADVMLGEINDASLKTEITANIKCPLCGKEAAFPYPFRFDEYMADLR